MPDFRTVATLISVIALSIAIAAVPWVEAEAQSASGAGNPNAAIEFSVRGSLLPPELEVDAGDVQFAALSDFRDPIQLEDPFAASGQRAQPEGAAPAGPVPDQVIGPPLYGPEAPLVEIEEAAPLIGETAEASEADDPFRATGIRVGSFLIRPRLELGITATDNVDGGPVKQDAVGLLANADITGRSDWSRHEVYFELRGEADLYKERGFDDGFVEGVIGGRLDLTDRTGLTASAGYAYNLENFTDPTTPAAAAERPSNQSYVGRVGFVHDNNSVRASVSGRLTRRVYDDVALVGGGSADQSFRDRTISALEGRAALRPDQQSLAPVGVAEVGKTRYDQRVDPLGFERSNVWFELRGGLLIDRGPKLQGEVTIGYRSEKFDDPLLADLNALVVSADMAWSPARLTTVRLDIDTFTDSSSIASTSGSLTYAGVASIERRFRNRFFGEVGAGYSHETFRGLLRTDRTYLGYGELGYYLSRYAALVARYGYERTDSTDPSAAGNEHRVSGFVRLER